jgi:short-subunit dehydrogenase
MNRSKLKEGKNGGGLWAATAIGVGVIGAYVAWSKKRPKYDFDGKIVVITGGSRGLGLVLARTFAAEGAKLAICARDSEELKRAEKDLKSRGAEVFQDVCDVRNQNEVNEFIEKVCSYYGHIDVLVNNAGVIQVGPLEVQTKEDFENALAVHFWGPYHTMSAVAPKMRERGAGKIVNISSIGGKMSVPHLAPYCASKFALVGLSNAMRVELAKDNIDVTTVCPGLMRTGSHINAIFKGKNQQEFAWFSIANGFPLASISAESAAKEIVEACRKGEAEKIVSIQAELAAKMNALFPELVAEISGLINQVLPSKGGIGEEHATGLESTSFASPSFLTALVDKESYQNNELKQGETL